MQHLLPQRIPITIKILLINVCLRQSRP